MARATDAEKRFRASEADRLLNEPLLVAAFDRLEQSALADMLNIEGADPEDDRKRRMLADRVNTIRKLRQDLHSAIKAGEHAATQIQQWA